MSTLRRHSPTTAQHLFGLLDMKLRTVQGTAGCAGVLSYAETPGDDVRVARQG
jgi:hypothetical protein